MRFNLGFKGLICPLGADLLHVDRHMNMAKVIVTFHGFVNMPRKSVGVMSEWLSLLLHGLG